MILVFPHTDQVAVVLCYRVMVLLIVVIHHGWELPLLE